MFSPRPGLAVTFSRLLPVLVLALGGCAAAPGARQARAATPTEEPANLSDAKAAVLAYVDSGAYARDFAAVAADARAWIERRAAGRRPGERLAIVVDIDETALSNLAHMRAQDLGYHPQAWEKWIDSASAPALPPLLELHRAARARDVAVLFLTGRKGPRERAGTEANLRREGFTDYAALRLSEPADAGHASAAARKAAARAAWSAEGWTIIATIGDQESDLVGGHAERAFKLPNPFYRIP